MTRKVLTLAVGLTLIAPPALADGKVELLRTPHKGRQPDALADNAGSIHLLYVKGDRKNGNLFYVKREPGDLDWSAPLRVNSEDGIARRYGVITCPQMALGQGGRSHLLAATALTT